MSHDANNFYTSDKVTLQQVSFKNQYQMTVAGTLFVPKGLDTGKRHPAIVVGHPMGATKEQSANLYATKLAEQGFVTLSLDLSFWGESEASHAMRCRRISMRKTSAQRWISWARRHLWTARRSVRWASAAVAAS
ncbi:alpha/beta hydrolase [Xanthomonas campestris pv. campestris]|nr:alpha-beta hydrolase superfamily protein [Xanthomonas campestris pv. raphani 756C]MEB2183914.1 alpha/beta hydrolase [Xanthomonas campestris pv. campestris]